MKKILMIVAAIAVIVGIVIVAGCSNPPEPRDLDAYVCGDETKNEEDRETDPAAIANADCIVVVDETDAEDDELGTIVGEYQPRQ